MDIRLLKRRITFLLIFFVLSLIASGLTAMVLPAELALAHAMAGPQTLLGRLWPGLAFWVERVYQGVSEAREKYPFILYGMDWLAFGHVAIAVAFWGPLRDPIRNLWVVEFGMIACVLVVPWALILGPVRGIPLLWRLGDCSFGVFGIIPLWLARRDILRMAAAEAGGRA